MSAPDPHGDDAWFEALAGRASHDDHARAEALALRTALLQWPEFEGWAGDAGAATARPVSEAEREAQQRRDEERLIERARQLGLLRPHRCAGCARRARWLADRLTGWSGPRTWVAGLAVAALAALIVLPVMPPGLRGPGTPDAPPAPGTPDTPEAEAPGVGRAGPDGVVMLSDDQPAALRDRIADALTAAGAGPAQRYERLGRAGLDVTLPQPVPPAVAAVLRQHRLPAPADGVLRVEVAQRAAR